MSQTGYFCLRQFGAININGAPIACPSCGQITGPWMLTATPARTAYILCVCGNRFSHHAVTSELVLEHFTIDSCHTSTEEVEANFLANPTSTADGEGGS